jgi:hypothetical protein
LVLLGGVADLRPHLAALGRIGAGGALADAIAFGNGMCDVVEHGERAKALEATLARNGGHDAWSNLLAAMAHREKGELGEEFTALSAASRLSDSPLTKAALVRSLRAMGKVTEADALRTALRRELADVQLRRRLQHPLLGPELALAYMVP